MSAAVATELRNKRTFGRQGRWLAAGAAMAAAAMIALSVGLGAHRHVAGSSAAPAVPAILDESPAFGLGQTETETPDPGVSVPQEDRSDLLLSQG